MAASISRLNKLACRPVMQYSLVNSLVNLVGTSLHANSQLNKVKFKYGVFRSVKNFSSSAARLITGTSTTSNHSSEISLGKRQTFDEMVDFRKKEARASVVIQVGNPSTSVNLVNQVCSKHGNVKNIFHYTHRDKELLILELDSEASVLDLLAHCSHNNTVKVIPTVSPFLWLRAMPTDELSAMVQPLANPPALTADTLANDNLEELLSNAESVSDQLIILDDQTRLTEIGKRLRWITCVQIERMLSGLFPSLQVLPFGSFVNGCGRNGGDLDMVVSLDGTGQAGVKSPLIFQAKAAINNPRLQVQRHIEIFADILQNFTTGCIQVQRVLQARVPIVKFYHEFTGVDCDLSMGTLTGVFMSELLYLFSEMDWRFRPLVTAVRHWAAWARLTDMNPSPKITNFTLTLLVIFYLQRCSPPILPTLGEMMKLARPDVDTRQTNDIDCTFLRDPAVFVDRAQLNQESLENLFLGFLHFVESFNFSEQSISIVTGKTARKSDSKPLYVQNPLERDLNVSRNVNLKELTHVVMEARNALYILETRDGQSPDNWGLLALPRAEKVQRLNPKVSHHTTSQLNIKDLFTSDFKEDGDDFVGNRSTSVQQSCSEIVSVLTSVKQAKVEERPPSAMNGFITRLAQRKSGLKTIYGEPRSLSLKSEKNSRRIEKNKRK